VAKKVDLKAKAKRQKVIAAVGGVLLLGVLAFQVPRTMKLLHQSNASASSETTPATSATTTPIAPPSLGGGNATAGATVTTADGVADPNGAVSPVAGQLLAFSRFKSKDPFAQQLDANCGTDSGSDCGSTGGGSTISTGATGRKGRTAPPPVAPPTKLSTAEISVNGSSETVQVGAQFPASNPTFVLVSLGKSSARVGIAGGSLAGSKQAVTLKKNVPLTLMNTSDGTRYVLRLLSVS
jgi:hypothetical protein